MYREATRSWLPQCLCRLARDSDTPRSRRTTLGGKKTTRVCARAKCTCVAPSGTASEVCEGLLMESNCFIILFQEQERSKALNECWNRVVPELKTDNLTTKHSEHAYTMRSRGERKATCNLHTWTVVYAHQKIQENQCLQIALAIIVLDWRLLYFNNTCSFPIAAILSCLRQNGLLKTDCSSIWNWIFTFISFIYMAPNFVACFAALLLLSSSSHCTAATPRETIRAASDDAVAALQVVVEQNASMANSRDCCDVFLYACTAGQQDVNRAGNWNRHSRFNYIKNWM